MEIPKHLIEGQDFAFEEVLDLRTKRVEVDREVVEDEINFEKDPYTKLTYLILCMYGNWQTRQSYPSVKTIAKKVGCSERKIKDCIKKLQELELIAIIPRYKKDGSQMSNLYILLDTTKYREKCRDMHGEGEHGAWGGCTPCLQNNSKSNDYKNNIVSGTHDTSILKKDLDEGAEATLPSKDSYSEEFETMWGVYPRKTDKKQAWMKYKQVRKQHSAEVILKGVNNYAKECQQEQRQQQYIKHAKTFLNGECFMEYQTEAKTASSKPKSLPSIGEVKEKENATKWRSMRNSNTMNKNGSGLL